MIYGFNWKNFDPTLIFTIGSYREASPSPMELTVFQRKIFSDLKRCHSKWSNSHNKANAKLLLISARNFTKSYSAIVQMHKLFILPNNSTLNCTCSFINTGPMFIRPKKSVTGTWKSLQWFAEKIQLNSSN